MISLSAALDARAPGALQRRVVALCMLVSLLEGYDIAAMAYVTPAVAAQWGLAPATFAPILAAALVGIMVGTLMAGPLGDRVGRRWPIVGACVAFGIASIATATAGTPAELLIWRFITGIGLGAGMPNAIAITAEYMPARYRTLSVSLTSSAITLGGFFGGLLAAWLLAHGRWQDVFILGGVVPLAVALPLAWSLPESLGFLALKPGGRAELDRLWRRIAPGTPLPAPDPPHTEPGTVAALFTRARAPGSVALWVVFFGNLMLLYALQSWLPVLVAATERSASSASAIAAVMPLGGVMGGPILAYVVDRRGAFKVLPAAFVGTALVIAAIGTSTGHDAWLIGALFLAGAGVYGAQFCINALAADLYPTAVRSTGVGWALGVGRIGAILGPFAGGSMLAAGLPLTTIFALAAMPPLICAAGLVALRLTDLGAAYRRLPAQ